MAKRKKSDQRKLAELVAKQRNIKVKSAQDWLRRVATGKTKTPRFSGLSEYAKRKTRAYKKSVAAKPKQKPAAKKDEIIQAIPEPIRRVNYRDSEQHILSFRGEITIYSGKRVDKRTRTIRLNVSGRELNEFMNADGSIRAFQNLGRTKDGHFLQGADIEDVDSFSVDGKNFDTGFLDY